MTLTEKWEKGELPDGMYYMENTRGIIGRVGHSKAFPCYNVKQILAPVPSYKEWQQLRKWCEEFNALDVVKENQQLKNRIRKRNRSIKKVCDLAFERKKENKQLKELLKECREFFEEENPKDFTVMSERMDELLTKIDNAIGEKK